jgi:hypothetical protein
MVPDNRSPCPPHLRGLPLSLHSITVIGIYTGSIHNIGVIFEMKFLTVLSIRDQIHLPLPDYNKIPKFCS